MSRLFRAMIAALAIGTVFAAPANAAPDEEFVVGAGAIEVPNPLFPSATILLEISIDAHSDASGGDPTGTLLVTIQLNGQAVFSGPVTCLVVKGTTAIIGINDVFLGHVIFEVVDNSATGVADTIGYVTGLNGCSIPSGIPVEPLVSGDFVVHDALPLTSKDQCKLGGWRDFTDDEGQPFVSQGACIAFVQHAT